MTTFAVGPPDAVGPGCAPASITLASAIGSPVSASTTRPARRPAPDGTGCWRASRAAGLLARAAGPLARAAGSLALATGPLARAACANALQTAPVHKSTTARHKSTRAREHQSTDMAVPTSRAGPEYFFRPAGS